jgi:hypothetical protein
LNRGCRTRSALINSRATAAQRHCKTRTAIVLEWLQQRIRHDAEVCALSVISSTLTGGRPLVDIPSVAHGTKPTVNGIVDVARKVVRDNGMLNRNTLTRGPKPRSKARTAKRVVAGDCAMIDRGYKSRHTNTPRQSSYCTIVSNRHVRQRRVGDTAPHSKSSGTWRHIECETRFRNDDGNILHIQTSTGTICPCIFIFSKVRVSNSERIFDVVTNSKGTRTIGIVGIARDISSTKFCVNPTYTVPTVHAVSTSIPTTPWVSSHSCCCIANDSGVVNAKRRA